MPRGSKPGERRGGRKPGTRNKRTLETIELAAKLGVDPVSGQIEMAAWALSEWRRLVLAPAPKTPEKRAERLAEINLRAEQASAFLSKAAPYIRPRLAVIDASQQKRLKTHEEALAELEGGPQAGDAGAPAATGALGALGALSAALGDDAEDFGEDA